MGHGYRGESDSSKKCIGWSYDEVLSLGILELEDSDEIVSQNT